MPITETRLDKILGAGSGTGSRPAAGNAGARWIDTTGPTETFDNGAAWVALAGGGGSTVTASMNILATNTSMTTSGTAYNGPTLTLAAGTYLIWGAVNLYCAGAAATFRVQLWDGSAIKTSAYTSTSTAAEPVNAAIPPFYVVLGGSTTYTIRAISSQNTSLIVADAGLGDGATGCSLVALKIA